MVVLVRQERLKKFAELWKQAHLDFYNSQTMQAAELRKQSDKIFEPVQATEEEHAKEK